MVELKTKSNQDNVSSENGAADRRKGKGGVELDFSGMNFSDGSGITPRKCGAPIPKIKY